MIRDKKLEIRLTTEELNEIENKCRKNSITKSELIRRSVKNNDLYDTGIVLQNLFNMQSIINTIWQHGTTVNSLNSLSEHINHLYQYFKN